MRCEFVLFGAVEVRLDGCPVSVGGARQQCVLAVLLVDLGTVVRTDQLMSRVWGESPPHRARATLHTYVSRLRRALAAAEGVLLEGQTGAYRLHADPQTVDVHRFHRLLAQARSAAGDGDSAERLEQALALWQGEPFAGLDSPWLASVRASLDQERHSAELDLAERGLRRGRHAELLPALRDRARAHPFDERVAAQAMLALYRSGRQAEALEEYQRVRLRLADDLGVDPGASLQRLYQQILSAAPDIDRPEPMSAPVTPRQLPAAPATFVGRARELATLGERREPAAAAWALSGGGGVGKTWLALRWAHEHVAEFPDGQLFVNLRGFDPVAEPVSAEAALGGFLTALGVAAASIPVGVDARAGLYRSLVASRRMLVVLDNARDTAQVAPLLPGGRSATLITSRRRLDALLTTHDVRPLPLGTVDERDARAILLRRLGADRVNADPAATEGLVRHCAGLPLALGIVASQAAIHPDFPLASLAAELCAADERLDAFDTGELPWGLRTALSASYRVLSVQAAVVFRALGFAPGPDIAVPTAAALAGLPRPAALTAITELETASLVGQPRPGRYRMHDLTHLYAAELAHAEHTEADRAKALARLFGHYCYVAATAADLLDPAERYRRPPIPAPSGPTVALPDAHSARAWLDAERDNLVAAARVATRHLPAAAKHLSFTLYRYFDNGGHFKEALTLHTAARDAADPDSVDRSYALCARAHTLVRLGRYDEALHDASEALRNSPADQLVKYSGSTDLGIVHELRGDHDRAVAYYLDAVAASQAAGHRVNLGNVLNNLGDLYRKLGRYDEADDHLRRSLAIAEEAGATGLAAAALTCLGDLEQAQGRHRNARASYGRALDLVRARGHRGLEAELLNDLATAEAGCRESLALHQEALRLASDIHSVLEQARAHHALARIRLSFGEPGLSRHHATCALRLYAALQSPHAAAVESFIRERLDPQPAPLPGHGVS